MTKSNAFAALASSQGRCGDLGYFRSLREDLEEGHFRSFMAKVCAKVLSQVYAHFCSFKPKTGSLSRTIPPGSGMGSGYSIK